MISQDLLGAFDRPHFPEPGSARARQFKEWFHFLVMDGGGTDLIANMAFSGDVRGGTGVCDLIALGHHPGLGWSGSVERVDVAPTQVKSPLDLSVNGRASLRFADGRWHVSIVDASAGIRMHAALVPLADPLLGSDAGFGLGLSWLSLPQLRATGCYEADGRRHEFADSCGYHDHNWGFFDWGSDLGWVWGFLSAVDPDAAPGRLSVVFTRTSDRGGEALRQTVLAVWAGSRLLKVFTGGMLRSKKEGRFTGRVPRRPGVASLVDTSEVQTVPRLFFISARDGADWLDLEYRIDAALQLGVPSDFGFGIVGLNETFGTAQVRGSTKGRPHNVTTRACFEFLA